MNTVHKQQAQQNETRAGAAPMRVALCYSGCHARGGVERVVLEAARHLRANCSVSVLAKTFPQSQELSSDIQLVPVGGMHLPFGFDLRATRERTRCKLAKRGWDVVAGFGVQAPEDSVVWVQSVHAAWWELCRRRRRGLNRWIQAANPFHKIVLKMERELLRERRFKRLIALTQGVKADLVRLYGVSPGDVDVLPNGFRESEFSPDLQGIYRDEFRRSMEIPEAAWVILFVANEWERKGLIPLLEAVSKMRDSSVHLVVVGRLPAKMIEARAATLGLKGRVHIIGPTGRVNRWFGMADVFALPTSYEAWGMVIIEALAAGLPVLTAKTAGAALAVTGGSSGQLLDDPTDPNEVYQGLVRLRNGVEWSATAIASSVLDYEWSRILEKYEGILRATSC